MKLKRYFFFIHSLFLFLLELSIFDGLLLFIITFIYVIFFSRVVLQQYAKVIDDMYEEADREMAAAGGN